MQEQKNNLSIPGAIILAGILIAGGIYMSNKKDNIVVEKNVTTTEQLAGPITEKDHILGNPNAPIVILEYSDTECPYCKIFQKTMDTVISTYGKEGNVAWVYRHFPVHSRSSKEAEATECATELGGNTIFWKYISEIYATTTSTNTLDPSLFPVMAKDVGIDTVKFNQCLESGKYSATVQTDAENALKSGAQGTPYSIMILKEVLDSGLESKINDYIISNNLESNISISGDKKEIVLNGALPLEIVEKIIDTILK